MDSNTEEDDYFLEWEKHHSAFVSFFSGLFRKSLLVDCTLAAEEKYIKAHRIVLMACSPYFEELLSDHCDNFPIVFLNIKFTELQSIIDFCYRGQVRVSPEDLDGFLTAANMLRIRGLSDGAKHFKSFERPVTLKSVNHNKRRKSLVNGVSEGVTGGLSEGVASGVSDGVTSDVRETFTSGVSDGVTQPERSETSDEDETEVQEKKQKLMTPELLESLVKDLQSSEETQGSDISDVDTDDGSYESGDEEDLNLDISNEHLLMQATGSLLFPWSCNRCGQAFSSKVDYQKHRKSCDIVPFDHPWKCSKCPSCFKNKKDLIRHLKYCGQDHPRIPCERCGKTYKYSRGLRRHQEYCGKSDVELLKCPNCDKAYKYKRGLRRHQRQCTLLRTINILQKKGVVPPMISTKKEEKDFSETKTETLVNSPLECSACGKTYKYVKSFQRHQISCKGP